MMVGGVEKMTTNEKKGMRKEYKWPACRGLSESTERVSVCV